MIIDIAHSELIIGDCDNQLQLINLPFSEGLDFSYQLPNGKNIVSAMNNAVSTKSKLSRVIELLQKLPIATQSQQFEASPTYWLLPNLDKPQLSEWVSALHHQFPHCFSHPQSRFFPMGSASLPIALTAIDSMGPEISSVNLIAVDSLFFDMPALFRNGELIDEDKDSGVRPSEAVIMAQVDIKASHFSSVGLKVTGLFQESSVAAQQTQAIERLFYKAGQVDTQDIFSQIYLPGDHQAMQDSWLNAYEQLAGKIDQDTQITQSNYYTGNIGSAAGLYNFLHIFNRYKEQELKGTSVQLEISSQLHLGLAVYTWHENQG